jgi:SAM-dependent methyltransferase
MKNDRKASTTIDLWKKSYSSDQENLYKNFIIRSLFDLGHKYIVKKDKDIDGTILDIGSGMGYHLKFETLSERRKYICLDSDGTMLDRIKTPGVKKIAGSCSNIPLKTESLDVIIASHIVEHLPDLAGDLQELFRVLKPRGKLIVVLPCDPGLLWRLSSYITPSRRRLKRIGIDYDEVMRHEHVNPFKKCKTELQRLFIFEDEVYYPFLVPSFHLNLLCCLTGRKRL